MAVVLVSFTIAANARSWAVSALFGCIAIVALGVVGTVILRNS